VWDRPQANSLTQKTSTPDYHAVIEAIARSALLRLLVDGTAAGIESCYPACG